MASDSKGKVRHQLDFTIYNLPSTILRIDFPVEADAEQLMLSAMPSVQIGSSYVESPIVVSNLMIQPRRIQMELISPPALLPLSIQLSCPGPFIFGWLQVPEGIQTVVSTVAQNIRIVGPGYWALPLGQGVAIPVFPPTKAEAAAKPETRPAAADKPAEKAADKPDGETRTLDAVVRTARSGQPAPTPAPAPQKSSRETAASPA